MKNWTITTRISVCLAVLTLIICALAYTSYQKILLIEDKATDISENSLPSLLLEHELSVKFQENRIKIRALMEEGLTAEKRRAIEDKIKANDERIAELHAKYVKELLSDDSDKNLITQAIDTYRDVLRVQTRVLETINAPNGNLDAAWQIIDTELSPLGEKYLEQLQADWEYNDSLAANYYNTTKKAGEETERFMLVLGIGGVVLAVVLGTLLIVSTTRLLKRVASGLSEVAVQVSAAASQVSGSSQALSTAASEQASSVEETSASLEEMTSMLRGTSENAEKAKSLAAEAHAEAAAGSRTMSEMMEAMEAINTSSAEVASIVKEIDQIAFQTNILALNAAVEAARAGEAGAGFAVVADEVRALARRSAAAAQETATKIEVAISNTRNGSASSAKVGESLTKIAERVASTDQLVGDITRAAKEQALGIEQINSAISQMEKVSQSNASSAEESASAALELDTQAEALKGEVERLRNLVGGQSEAGPAAPARHPHRSATPAARGHRALIPMPGDRHSEDDADFRNF